MPSVISTALYSVLLEPLMVVKSVTTTAISKASCIIAEVLRELPDAFKKDMVSINAVVAKAAYKSTKMLKKAVHFTAEQTALWLENRRVQGVVGLPRHNSKIPCLYQLVEFDGYTLLYDNLRKVSCFTYEHLTSDSLEQTVKRECHFYKDKHFYKLFQADCDDYNLIDPKTGKNR